MVFVTIREAAGGTYAVDANIMEDNWAERDNWTRKVVRWAFGGSDALEECEAVLSYGKFEVGRIKNSQTTGALTDDDMVPISSRMKCFAGEHMKVELEGSVSATTPLTLLLDIKDIGRGGRR